MNTMNKKIFNDNTKKHKTIKSFTVTRWQSSYELFDSILYNIRAVLYIY